MRAPGREVAHVFAADPAAAGLGWRGAEVAGYSAGVLAAAQ
jgi:hypothetical protein